MVVEERSAVLLTDREVAQRWEKATRSGDSFDADPWRAELHRRHLAIESATWSREVHHHAPEWLKGPDDSHRLNVLQAGRWTVGKAIKLPDKRLAVLEVLEETDAGWVLGVVRLLELDDAGDDVEMVWLEVAQGHQEELGNGRYSIRVDIGKKRYALGLIHAFVSWGEAPADRLLSDAENRAGVPRVDPDKVARALAAEIELFNYGADLFPASDTKGVAFDGWAAFVREQARSANPHAHKAGKPHACHHCVWDAGWWVGQWRKANPGPFSKGQKAGSGHTTAYERGSIERAEFERGCSDRPDSYDRQADLDYALSGESVRARCPHDLQDGVRCSRCGLPWDERPAKVEIPDLDVHPYANAYPYASEAVLQALTADIVAHGLLEPIVLYDSQVLDGRNRLEACRRGNVEPSFVAFADVANGMSALEWVRSKNSHRRQLTPSQRAMVAVSFESFFEEAQKRKNAGAPAEERRKGAEEAAAAIGGTSTRSVERAREVKDKGVPELGNAVRDGDVDVSTAASLAKGTADEQRKVLEELEAAKASGDAAKVKEAEKATKKAAADIKKREKAEKAAKERERVAATAEKARNASPGHSGVEFWHQTAESAIKRIVKEKVRPHVVFADGPWDYDDKGSNGAASNHYPTMDVEDVVTDCAAVFDACEADAFLVVFVTNPFLEEWFEEVSSARGAGVNPWEWEYVTAGTIKRPSVGTGRALRSQTEQWLVYRKRKPRVPQNLVPLSFFDQLERLEHSEKAQQLLEDLVEAYCPEGGLVLELYARRAPAARAAGKLKRRCISVDADQHGHDLGVAAYTPPAPLFDKPA